MTVLEERTGGELVKWLRVTGGFTQDSLAEQVGCSTQTIRKIEAGARRPSYQMAARIAQIFGLPPEQRADFIQRVRQDAGDDPDAPAPVVPVAQELPSYLTAFIGREQEQATLLRMINTPECRLITLLGAGGIGKTRLAVTVAEQHGSAMGFVRFVSLVAVTEPRIVAEAIAAALGMTRSGDGDLASQLLDELRDKRLLLVLDNLEQLLDAQGVTVGVLKSILQQAPGVKLLVTSRERLRLQGEWVVEIVGLPVPADSRAVTLLASPAIQLFLERAKRVHHSFRLKIEDCQAIVSIARLVGGMPLGLELAASWAAVLSPQEIYEELARGIDDPLAIAHDRPVRHASLRAVFEQSWRLLIPAERQALSRLAVFSGGYTREAATEVAGTSIMMLAALVDKSLLRRRETGRYELHEVIRQCALEKLQEDQPDFQATVDRHSAYYANLLRQSIVAQTGGSSAEAWAALLRDIDNVRAAWTRATSSGNTAMVLAMARGMMFLYDNPGRVPEGRALFKRAVDALHGAGVRSGAALGITLGFEGYFLQLRQPAVGAPLLEEALSILEHAGDTSGGAHILLHLGTVQLAAGRFDRAYERYAQAGQLAASGNDQLTRLWALFFQGVIALYRGDRSAAEQNFTTCLDAWRSQQFQRGVSSALNWLSEVARQSGRMAEAAAYAREGLQISSTTNDWPGIARALRELGALALEQENRDEAAYLLAESCATFQSIGNPWVCGRSRALLMRLEVAQGRLGAARQGCMALLQLIRDGARMFLPEAAYGLALLQVATHRAPEALALLYALGDASGEHATLGLAAKLRTELEQRLGPEERRAAHELAVGRQLLPWMEELVSESRLPV